MKYIADVELDQEYLASKILTGLIYPKEYIDIRNYLCKLELVDISIELDEMLTKLQKDVVTPFGLLDDKEIEKYYYGKNPELFSLLDAINSSINAWIPTYTSALIEKEHKVIEELSEDLQGQDFVGMGEAINSVQFKKQEIDNIAQTKKQLQIFEGLINALLPLYGSNQQKLPTKKVKIHADPSYQLFLQDINSNIDQVAGNMDMAIVLGRLIKSIVPVIPKDSLDPYRLSEADNLLDTLTNPKD